MKTKDLVVSAILLAIGFILHFITPPIVMGIKPDFLLATMFIAIIYNTSIKNTLAVGIVAGIISALTTGFPGGQIPSIVDKIGSALVVYAILATVFRNRANTVTVGIIGLIGTIVSGALFLGSAAFIAGLPAAFTTLFLTIVLPTAVANLIFVVIVYRVMLLAMPKNKRPGRN